MSNMTINVEFLAGTNVRDAVTEAKQKAEELGVAYVVFNFNGVRFSIGSGCGIDDVMCDFGKGDFKHGICAP